MNQKKLTGTLLLIGVPSELSNLRYASGFAAVDPVVFLDGPTRRVLVVPSLEFGRAKHEVKRGVEVVTPAGLSLTRARRRRLSCWALGAVRQAGVQRVTVSPLCPVGVVRYLEAHDVRVKVCRGPLYEQRAIKTPAEVTWITAAQRAAAAAMRNAIQCIRSAQVDAHGCLCVDGRRLTSNGVRRVIDMALLERDCVGVGTIVAGGRKSADPHDQGAGPLRAGQPIVIDIFPRHRGNGFWGDMTRTVVKGRASAEIRAMYRAVHEAQTAALKTVKAGVSLRRVHEAVLDVFEKHDFSTRLRNGIPEGFIHSTGHGVGLDIHESPSVALVPGRLRAGHVITIEPGLYYPRIGGVRIEDTVLVTRDGYRMLAAVPKRLEV